MIGILTFVGTQSHGACLQAYALKKSISDLGYDAEIINYISPAMKAERDNRLPNFHGGAKKFLGRVRRYPHIRERYAKFEQFEKDCLGIDGYVSDIDYSRYRKIIAGSDQIWNPELTGNDLTFFLADLDDSSKKASYAASLGVNAFPKELEDTCIDLIRSFKYINVREQQLNDYLSKYIRDREIRTVPDPTLLLPSDAWARLIPDEPVIRGRYILVHYPHDTQENRNIIKKIAEDTGAETVLITNRIEKKEGCRCLFAVSPTEYLNLIRNAETIVTGSFHTLAFSLIFNRTFYCTKSMIAARNSRLSNLLALTGCEDRMLTNYPLENHFDFANRTIQEEREKALHILNEMCGEP